MELIFNKRLKELRKTENISQCQLAKMIGVAQSNVSDWENDVSRPEYENLIKIAEIFDVSTDYLLGLTDSF
ncbi:MAG: helix-turn-helix domain-containing protein [Clostridia bacterium]|nr:helix-turn-helix domain-containing protein [Clostridia bacterium]